jgi:RimJ/RimL family protein N-acetyltransferase
MAINAYRLPADVREVADTWWARDFAVDSNALRPPRTIVQEHAGRLVGAAGIWILVTGEFPMVSMPASVFSVLRETAEAWSSSLVADSAAIVNAIVPFRSTKVVGPAFIGYGTGDTLDLSWAERARPVSDREALAVDALRVECTAEEWEHGGGRAGDACRFGAADGDNRLCSLASYVVWDRLAHISVITRPAGRGHGYGRAAVALAAKHAIEAGLIPQYRTLASNAPSMQLARRLGFQEYGFSVFVRLAAI